MDPWLKQLRHDLVKRAVWAARDYRDLGPAATAADAAALREGLLELVTDEGAPTTATALFATLRARAPAGLPPRALDLFQERLRAAEEAVTRRDPAHAAGVILDLEAAFHELARHLEPHWEAPGNRG